ncbi:MAG: hypothetical protein WA459_22350 [Stellaceae bacterium]
MQWYLLVLASLSVWRLTHLLNAEDGPGAILAWLRAAAEDGIWGGLLDCFNCLSLWIAVPFGLIIGAGWGEKLLLWLGLSAAAILLERMTSGAGRANYIEDEQPPRE